MSTAIRDAFARAQRADSRGATMLTQMELESAVEAAILDEASPFQIDDAEKQALRAAWEDHFAQGGNATGYVQRLYRSRFDPAWELRATDYRAADFAPFTAREVTLPSGNARLAGTLLLPKGKGPFPAVVTATGSGPDTRDAGYFRILAEQLAARGIAVLRMDDRGQGASTPAIRDWYSIDLPTRASDVAAGVAFLRGLQDEAGAPLIIGDRIGLTGHSEGGMTSPMVAADDPGIAALALMAAPGAKGAEIIRYQTDDAMASIQRSIAQLEAAPPSAEVNGRLQQARAQLAGVSRMNQAARAVLGGQPLPESLSAGIAPYFRSFLQHDPLEVASRVEQPVLMLQGTEDWNVRVEQAQALAVAFRRAGGDDVRLDIFEGLEHTFFQAAGYHVETYDLPPDRDYTDALSEDVLSRTVDFFASRLSSAS
jgi:dipeptidyl aminopeptidase/acylaminoacyl peptidase